MVTKEELREEHLDAVRDERFSEVPEHLLERAKALVARQDKPAAPAPVPSRFKYLDDKEGE